MANQRCRCSRCGHVFDTDIAKNPDLVCGMCDPEPGLLQQCGPCNCTVKLKRRFRGGADSFKCEWCRIESGSNKGVRP